MTANRYNPLFRLVARSIKYFLLLLFGFVTVYAISMGIGASHIVSGAVPVIGEWLLRIATVLLGLLTVAVIIESLR